MSARPLSPIRRRKRNAMTRIADNIPKPIKEFIAVGQMMPLVSSNKFLSNVGLFWSVSILTSYTTSLSCELYQNDIGLCAWNRAPHRASDPRPINKFHELMFTTLLSFTLSVMELQINYLQLDNTLWNMIRVINHHPDVAKGLNTMAKAV